MVGASYLRHHCGYLTFRFLQPCNKRKGKYQPLYLVQVFIMLYQDYHTYHSLRPGPSGSEKQQALSRLFSPPYSLMFAGTFQEVRGGGRGARGGVGMLIGCGVGLCCSSRAKQMGHGEHPERGGVPQSCAE